MSISIDKLVKTTALTVIGLASTLVFVFVLLFFASLLRSLVAIGVVRMVAVLVLGIIGLLACYLVGKTIVNNM